MAAQVTRLLADTAERARLSGAALKLSVAAKNGAILEG
jgi:hypothetical protein